RARGADAVDADPVAALGRGVRPGADRRPGPATPGAALVGAGPGAGGRARRPAVAGGVAGQPLAAARGGGRGVSRGSPPRPGGSRVFPVGPEHRRRARNREVREVRAALAWYGRSAYDPSP